MYCCVVFCVVFVCVVGGGYWFCLLLGILFACFPLSKGEGGEQKKKNKWKKNNKKLCVNKKEITNTKRRGERPNFGVSSN